MTVDQIFAAHAQRDFGSTGVRQIQLDVYTAGSRAFSYDVIHAWKATHDECRSLFYLVSPKVLTGTAVLLIEAPASEDVEIWLRLRTADKPICVGQSHADEYVLGTDFTYEDLRFWLPTREYVVTSVSRSAKAEEDELVLDVSRHSMLPRHSKLRLHLDPSLFLPRKVEWIDRRTEIPGKVYEARNLALVDNVWSPTVIFVRRPSDRYLSVMSLRRAAHGLQLDESLFSPNHMLRRDADTLIELSNRMCELPISAFPELPDLIRTTARQSRSHFGEEHHEHQ